MMAVPRRFQDAADQDADPNPMADRATPKKRPVHATVADDESVPLETNAAGEAQQPVEPTPNGTAHKGAPPSSETALVRVEAAPLATTTSAPDVKIDPGLYAVLHLDPSASDSEIQTTYRRMAARLRADGSNDNQALKQLNMAYEVLGNPVRRAEYDRLRLSQSLSPGAPTPIRPGSKASTRITRRRRPRHAVQPRYAGLGDVLVVLSVVGLAVLAGLLLIPRLSINLSALNALQNVLPISNTSRRVIDTTVTAVPTAAATATPLPGVAARFNGTTINVSNPQPAINGPETVAVHLVRDGRPAANFDVWATVKYRTVEERWPASGALKTDASGSATISFNVGGATPNYPVSVHVFAQVDDQQLSWSTSFTPR
jgi:DnaJ-like protein